MRLVLIIELNLTRKATEINDYILEALVTYRILAIGSLWWFCYSPKS